jgi:hypothetical protein
MTNRYLPVTRISAGLSRDEFAAQHLRPDFGKGTLAPVVITGGASDWPAAQWTPESLAGRLGQRPVQMAIRSDGDVFGLRDDGVDTYSYFTLPFEDAIERVVSEDDPVRYYLRKLSLARDLPELITDVPAPCWMKEGPRGPFLWLGCKEAVSPSHWDVSNNFIAQLYGRKRMLLAAPDAARGMYCHHEASKQSFSRVDVENPDLSRYPAFADVRLHEVLLEPGDVLHLPAFWWHHARCLDVSITVNQWWEAEVWQLTAFQMGRHFEGFKLM